MRIGLGPRRLMQKFENYRLPDGLSVCDICLIESGKGGFAVAKILALEPGIAHIRLYWERLPTKIRVVCNAEWSFSDFFPVLILPAGLT